MEYEVGGYEFGHLLTLEQQSEMKDMIEGTTRTHHDSGMKISNRRLCSKRMHNRTDMCLLWDGHTGPCLGRQDAKQIYTIDKYGTQTPVVHHD